MILLAPPPTELEALTEIARLRQELAAGTLDEVVEARVERILAWEEIDDPVTRRFYRNSAVVYTRDELAGFVSLQIAHLLRTAPDLIGGDA